MDGFVGIVGCVEFGLAGEEEIIRNAVWTGLYLLKVNSSFGDLSGGEFTFCIVVC
jgi:hypothetical protein